MHLNYICKTLFLNKVTSQVPRVRTSTYLLKGTIELIFIFTNLPPNSVQLSKSPLIIFKYLLFPIRFYLLCFSHSNRLSLHDWLQLMSFQVQVQNSACFSLSSLIGSIGSHANLKPTATGKRMLCAYWLKPESYAPSLEVAIGTASFNYMI